MGGSERHSVIARSTSTASTAVPSAVTTAPTRPPNPSTSWQLPVHCSLTSDQPMRPPQAPPNNTAAKASTRAPTDGRADRIAGVAARGGSWLGIGGERIDVTARTRKANSKVVFVR